jgi:hypothetical protein
VKCLRYGWVLRVLLLPLLVSPFAAGQVLHSADLSLENLNLSAGTVFSGTVIQIEHAVAPGAKPAFVRVKFRVDQAVRGCNAGDTVTVDEWAELWVRGDRYRKGQRVLILLYPPGQTGFSSPVAGDVGTFRIGPESLLRTTPQQTQVLASQATSSQSGARSTHGSPDPPKTRPRLRSIPEQKKLALSDEDSE